MKKKTVRAAAIALLTALLLVACSGGGSGTDSAPAVATIITETNEAEDEDRFSDTPLVVACSGFEGTFSPFFALTEGDMEVNHMVGLPLLSCDRTGSVVFNGIDGETIEFNGTVYSYYGPADLSVTENEDGTVYYDFKLREDLVFSDGEPVTIDDVIFTLYVLCDPTYDGSNMLCTQPIEGLEAYRSGMVTRFFLMMAAGADNTDFEYWTEEEQTLFWERFNTAAERFVQEIVDSVTEAGVVEAGAPMSEIMTAWGLSNIPETATNREVFDALTEAYGGDVMSMIVSERAGASFFDLLEGYDEEYASGISFEEAAESISGIQKTGDYSMRVVATELSSSMIYQLMLADTGIAPLHYYGDKAQFDPGNNSFGFPKGDLSMMRAKKAQPLGAGQYVFRTYEDGTVSLEANENYFLGAPKTKNMKLKEMPDEEKINALVSGTADIAIPVFSEETVQAIHDGNGGALTGNKLTTVTVDNLGYGYIGINARNVRVGWEDGSDASKNLRRAFATVFSVYRDTAVEAYYGERADINNYPISATSWAALRPANDGYRTAFSTDVNGKDIYTSEMEEEARYAAAKEAALGFLEAAGFIVEDGRVTAAPEGAKLEYEALVPGEGKGDHPSYMILTNARDLFEEIGISLVVTDPEDSSELWSRVQSGQAEIWCAAWGATVDPDMYQIYYADVAGGGANPGPSNFMFQIADAELDGLILEARDSTNRTYRKEMYLACLDIVLDWACEVPVYQRKNAIVYSTERINIDTITPDQTTLYGWWHEAYNFRMAY